MRFLFELLTQGSNQIEAKGQERRRNSFYLNGTLENMQKHSFFFNFADKL